MNRSIKNHIAEHKKADYGLALDSSKEFLKEQILLVASKLILTNLSQSRKAFQNFTTMERKDFQIYL
jgi:hypothetical protein